MPSPRRYVSTARAPRDRGLDFGRAHVADVRRTTARYTDLFAQRGGTGFDAGAWAGRFREAIGDLAPASLAEIDGIAEGAGVEPLDVVALNARTEILAKADPYGERPFVSECSAVLASPAEGPAYAVQTWDWYAAMADGWLVWRIAEPDEGPGEGDGDGGGWVETVTEHGLLGKIGVSSRGVGVMLNILHHRADDSDVVGLPVHVLARRILDTATSAEDALRLCRETPVAASTALTLVDRDGGVGVELFPGGPGELRAHPNGPDGLLVRTNHFLSEPGRPGCLTREGYPSTHVRLDRLEKVLGDRPPAGPADVLAAMEHHDPAGGVCRHEDDVPPGEERIATLATVVVEPAGPRLTAYAGGPCGRALTGR